MKKSSPSYRRSAINGVSWQTVFKLGTTALTAGKLFILARMLTPLDFGLFSLATIALGITEAATETGINVFLLQPQHKVKDFLDTAWVVAIIRGLIIAAVMLVLSIFMSRFYGQDRLLLLIALAASVPLIKGFINPAIILMHKNLLFFSDSMYHLSLRVVETAAVLILVWLNPTVMMLIVGTIVAATFEVILSFWLFPLRPKWAWNSSRAQAIFKSARGLNLSAILSYVHENADNLLIGKLTSATQLGYYHNSYVLAHKPNLDLAASVHHSTLPIFTQMKRQSQQLKNAFWQSRLWAMVGFTILTLPLLVYPQLVVWLLGPQWVASIPLIRPLALAGLLQSWSTMSYTLFFAQENYRFINQHLFWTSCLMIGGILLVTPQFDAAGASWAIFGARLATLSIIFWGLHKTWGKRT